MSTVLFTGSETEVQTYMAEYVADVGQLTAVFTKIRDAVIDNYLLRMAPYFITVSVTVIAALIIAG